MSVDVINALSPGWVGGSLDYGSPLGTGQVPWPAAVLKPDSVVVQRLVAQDAQLSPYDYTPQVADHGGRAWRVVIRLGPIAQEEAQTLADFMTAIATRPFGFDLDPWLPNDAAPAGFVVFEAFHRQRGHESNGQIFGARIEAVQARGALALSDVISAALPYWRGGDLDYELLRRDVVDAQLPGWVGISNDFEGYPEES